MYISNDKSRIKKHFITNQLLFCQRNIITSKYTSMNHKKHNIDLGAGYPCFVISIAAIGVCTAVIGDVAGHLGCFIYLKDSVNAIAFVALGTSVPGKNIKEYNLQKEAFNAVS